MGILHTKERMIKMKFVEADAMFVLLHCWNIGELLGSSLLLFCKSLSAYMSEGRRVL